MEESGRVESAVSPKGEWKRSWKSSRSSRFASVESAVSPKGEWKRRRCPQLPLLLRVESAVSPKGEWKQKHVMS